MKENFFKGNYGVFTHYLTVAATTSEAWNARTAQYDAKGLAKQLHEAGAKWLFFTLGQASGHFAAPNSTYDRIAGVHPSRCSKRDLVEALYEALAPYGIKLCLYMPSEAPNCPHFGWRWGKNKETGEPTGDRLADFQLKWEAVIEEWSLRWGRKIAAWWVDSCYFADQMYRFEDRPNFHSFAAALRAGNPDALLAFNNGKLPPESMTEEDDYTAGELITALPVAFDRFPLCVHTRDGAVPLAKLPSGLQYHLLCSLGRDWGHLVKAREPRFPDALVRGYNEYITGMGGAMTWEVPVDEYGLIPEAFVRQLRALRS